MDAVRKRYEVSWGGRGAVLVIGFRGIFISDRHLQRAFRNLGEPPKPQVEQDSAEQECLKLYCTHKALGSTLKMLMPRPSLTLTKSNSPG